MVRIDRLCHNQYGWAQPFEIIMAELNLNRVQRTMYHASVANFCLWGRSTFACPKLTWHCFRACFCRLE
jgi:hypothetical protein